MKKTFALLLISVSLFLIVSFVSAASLYGDSDTEIRVGANARINADASASSDSNVSFTERERIRAHILSRARMGLNLSEEDFNGSNGAILRARLSNGAYADIRVMPDRASIIARERARARCEANNCTFELREIVVRDEARAAYRVRVEKEARVLGLFRARMNVDVDIDADTGEIIEVHRPWWAGFSSEEDVEVESNITG